MAMFTIRTEQLQALSASQASSFDNRMRLHLEKFFPEQCGALDEARIIEAVHYGIARASTYGLISERDVCKYVDLMFALGRDFDTDPQFDWVQPMLTDANTPDPGARIELLYDAALTRIRHAASAANQS
jgi:hypothetical protein